MNNSSTTNAICLDKAPVFLLRKLAFIKQHENWQRPIVFKRDPSTETFTIYAHIRGKLVDTFYSFYPETMEID